MRACYFHRCSACSDIYAPTSKNLEGHIVFALFVIPFVRFLLFFFYVFFFFFFFFFTGA